jgi:2-oxoglutarate ferredoxin oxidoreductase subunit alpha
MEKVVLPPFKPRRTDEEIERECPWASTGRKGGRPINVITSLELLPEAMEKHNLHLQEKYKLIRETEVRYEELQTEDAEYLIVAFGSAARIAQKAISILRAEGVRVGLLRPITLWPFPSKRIQELSEKVKGILSFEINAGQMVEDVRLAVEGRCPVAHYGKMGGIVPTPDELIQALESDFQIKK